MKKYLFAALALLAVVPAFLLFYPGTSAALDHKTVFMIGRKDYVSDGQTRIMDVTPFIYNGRAYIPVRFLGNALGIPDPSITWDDSSKTVSLFTEVSGIRATVNSNVLSVNNSNITMDVTPLLKNARVFLPARWLAESVGYEVKWDEESGSVLIGPPGNLPELPQEDVSSLPAVGSYENLKSLLANLDSGYYNERLMLESAPADTGTAMKQSAQAPAPSADASSEGASYSKTNIQVEGVDEADIVKTDGSYIYYVSGRRVIITEAYPPGEMKVAGIIDYAAKNFAPVEIYVDDTRLVVIGNVRWSGDLPKIMPMMENGSAVERSIMPPYYRSGMLKVLVYDISDKTSPKLDREFEMEGNYASSRKIGSSLYLVANRSIYCYPLREIDNPKPVYRDSAAGDSLIEIDYPDIKYFPCCIQPNYLIVAGLNLDSPAEKVKVYAYLGSGENIYASLNSLYVAAASRPPVHIMDTRLGLIAPVPPVDWQKTRIYKFDFDNGQLKFSAEGEVPGTVLNQFSMDEYNNYFRIATTSGEIWRSGQYTSRNNVYILDSKLKGVGEIEDIAPGERIYSARFTGDRGYLVTFKKVDPFFVIDLKDPARPRILGALKIPGYSDYLHPYDENHVIGFGKDTIEIGQKDGSGGETGSMAFYQGMKMAVFNVSDVGNPVEMFKETIGDRGTDSPLLHNHKALLFSKENKLLAFPVMVMEVKGSGVTSSGFPEYGQFVFQGAYVYNFDLVNGFDLKGKITHLSDEDYLKAGSYWRTSDKDVQRVIYIGDTLYTLSNQLIKANSLADLEEIKTVPLK